MSDQEEQTPREPAKERILSVDVLRGFDMFWITGGGGFVAAVLHLCGGKLEEWFVPTVRQPGRYLKLRHS